jgi:hypothetical protein
MVIIPISVLAKIMVRALLSGILEARIGFANIEFQ